MPYTNKIIKKVHKNSAPLQTTIDIEQSVFLFLHKSENYFQSEIP